MELGIIKTELPATKFMLPPAPPSVAAIAPTSVKASATHSFLDRPVNINDLFNFNASQHLFKTGYQAANNSVLSDNSNSVGNGSRSGSNMRLKKNRKVTFLSNLVEVSFHIEDRYILKPNVAIDIKNMHVKIEVTCLSYYGLILNGESLDDHLKISC